jgi:arylsulfatase
MIPHIPVDHVVCISHDLATEVDTACGAILEELRRQGELDNTMIIFTTDNGNFHAEHGLADKW